MALPYELPATLVNALNSFDFKGRTIWTLASGMKHVKVELTFLLDQPTDRRARAMKRRPAPTPIIRLQETAPPTTDVVTVTRPTVTLQRPANSTTLMPPPTLRPPQQRVLELGATDKRRSQPAATSSPRNIAPPPMEVDIRPTSLGDLNNLHHKQIDDKNNDISKIFTFGKAWKYDSPEGCEATVLECRKADEKWEERKKTYVIRYGGLHRMFRQPGHLDHIPEWWNFLTMFQTEISLHQKRRATEAKDLLREAKDGYLYVVTPPPSEPPRK